MCTSYCIRKAIENYCRNNSSFSCQIEYFSSNDKFDCLTKCPLECVTERFEYTFGFSNFPPKNYFQEQSNFTVEFQSKTYDELKSTVLKLSIRYKHLSITYITQEQKTSVEGLIATIGGTLGCFIGASMLSLVEIIELFFQLQKAVCKSFKD